MEWFGEVSSLFVLDVLEYVKVVLEEEGKKGTLWSKISKSKLVKVFVGSSGN